MNAKEISSRKFDRGFNGYKPDEVDVFLREIASQFSQLQNDNSDLEKKLGVLADKVREYRDDEEAIKEAMLGAQKQGHATIAEAKEKAKNIMEESQDKADTMLAEARAASEKLKNESENNLKKANEEARKIHEEATVKQAKMEEEYRNRLDLNKEILFKTKNEVLRFRQKVLEDFGRITGIIDALPESCENDFISKTLTDYQKEKNVTLKKPAPKPEPAEKQPEKKKPLKAAPAAKEADEKEEGGSDALYEEFAAQMSAENQPTSFEMKVDEKLYTDMTTEIHFEPVFDEEEEDDTDLGAAEEFPADDADDAEKDPEEQEVPFFLKAQKESADREALDFGGNARRKTKQ